MPVFKGKPSGHLLTKPHRYKKMQNRAGCMITSQGCDMITDYFFKPIQNVSACLRNV